MFLPRRSCQGASPLVRPILKQADEPLLDSTTSLPPSHILRDTRLAFRPGWLYRKKLWMLDERSQARLLLTIGDDAGELVGRDSGGEVVIFLKMTAIFVVHPLLG